MQSPVRLALFFEWRADVASSLWEKRKTPGSLGWWMLPLKRNLKGKGGGYGGGGGVGGEVDIYLVARTEKWEI